MIRCTDGLDEALTRWEIADALFISRPSIRSPFLDDSQSVYPDTVPKFALHGLASIPLRAYSPSIRLR